MEKSVPRDHRLLSLCKPRNAKHGNPWDRFFYPTPTLVIDFYIQLITHCVILYIGVGDI